MTDSVLKGTGNSRYLKTIANALTQYPTYESFITALVNGTFPIDLNGINSAGFSTVGTPLNKANLLTDATAALLGFTSSATVNDMLAALANKVSGKAELELVSYTGTGTSGSANPTVISFSKAVDVVMFVGEYNSTNAYFTSNTYTIPLNRLNTYYKSGFGFVTQSNVSGWSQLFMKKNSDKNTISFYGTGAASQKNTSGNIYYYLGISVF